MDEQRQQGQEDERPATQATDEVADAELEQAAGGLSAGTYGRGLLGALVDTSPIHLD